MTDEDRRATSQLLAAAFGEGLLRVDELEERTARAFAARTFGELQATIADLPPTWIADVRRREAERQRAPVLRARWRREVLTYALVMTLLVGVWLVAAVAGGGWYPWPLWPAVFWGLALRRKTPRQPAPA